MSERPGADAAGSSGVPSTTPWLVVGLGNPGPRYARTRHNVGHLVVDELAARADASWRRHRSGRAEVAELRLGPLPGARVVLARPRAYMNDSGGPVSALLGFYRLLQDRLVAVHDEIDLPFGQLRVKLGGGDNGHNGLRSIRRSLGSGDYYRVRIGVGRPPGPHDPADYVLSPFNSTERRELPSVIQRSADCVESLILRGLALTQSEFNGPFTA